MTLLSMNKVIADQSLPKEYKEEVRENLEKIESENQQAQNKMEFESQKERKSVQSFGGSSRNSQIINKIKMLL